MNNDVQSSLERVKISWTSAEASRQCCLRSLSSAPLASPGHSQILRSCEIKSGSGLLSQGSKWLNGKELLTSIQKVLGSNPRWIPDFFVHGFTSHPLSINIMIHDPLIEYSEIVLQ